MTLRSFSLPLRGAPFGPPLPEDAEHSHQDTRWAPDSAARVGQGLNPAGDFAPFRSRFFSCHAHACSHACSLQSVSLLTIQNIPQVSILTGNILGNPS